MHQTDPQDVLAGLPQAAMFVTLLVEPGAEDATRDLLADLGGLRRSVGFRSPDDGLSCVVGIGSQLWDRLYRGPRPAHLHDFPGFTGAVHIAPRTPGDLLLHIRARRMDLCFELARLVVDRLGERASVVDEVHGFRYFDMRDLLGFVDGTENPEGQEAVSAALIGDEDPIFAGGSYVIVQKYLHDLGAWDALPVEDQERAIGRSKLEDVEMADDVKPANSHVALNTITDDDGEERQIVRFNMPFGSVGDGELGTYFIGYARNPEITEQMLSNMFVGDPPGTTDRLLDFSTAVTGALFFVPTVAWLESASDDPAAASDAGGPSDTGGPTDTAGPTGEHGEADGSLGIGSLRDVDR